ncbi:hypothetical protein BBJ29_001574 [Phytophthora kernoviae]|uniref:asparagine--tRNA ligase n=1 Tax=Phytophthora kernoviae TaxID=325452 RepID=A0A421G1P9_9STRA|nr:hypothetical protein BBJ29_001574 [Phytophthora kernoviae]
MLGRRSLGVARAGCRSVWAASTQQSQRAASTTDISKRSTIREARQLDNGARVAIGGWVKSVRKHKSVSFVNVNDGSCLGELQITLPAEEIEGETGNLGAKLSDIAVGASVFAEGELREVPGKHKRLELHPSSLDVLGNQGLHSYFQENDFLHLHSPILTSNDCEGAGEMFRLAKIDGKDEEFFGTPTYLTVSGQLHGEMYACALSKVYTFGPTFRAENSNTTRHLAEFWMVEPEMAFAGLEECITSAQGAIQRSVGHAMDKCAEDIAFFNKNYDKEITERLQRVVGQEFARLTYTEAIDVLQKAVADGKGKVKFEKKPEWGIDLQTEHERFLAEKYVGGPVFVTDYPADIKAFYMRKNAPDEQERETVAGMDLLVPKIGELVGGSVREERFELLEGKMRRLGLLPEGEIDDATIASAGGDLNWYLDLRRFGSVPHAGWGLGFERLVLFATGMDNIRDVIPLPRFPGQCKH